MPLGTCDRPVARAAFPAQAKNNFHPRRASQGRQLQRALCTHLSQAGRTVLGPTTSPGPASFERGTPASKLRSAEIAQEPCDKRRASHPHSCSLPCQSRLFCPGFRLPQFSSHSRCTILWTDRDRVASVLLRFPCAGPPREFF